MEDLGIGAGLAALGFWGFVAVAVVAGIWDNIRKRDAQHETVRRLIESGQSADDLAQQVFFQVWLKIHTLKEAKAFGGWLKRLAISIWLQHQRKNDALRGANELVEVEHPPQDTTSEGIDLDRALATLDNTVRLCIVLSYQQGLSHREIADLLDMPFGTVKSHINRGTKQLRQTLIAYREKTSVEKSK